MTLQYTAWFFPQLKCKYCVSYTHSVCVCARPPLEIKLSTQSWITCVLFMIFHAAITRCFPSISFRFIVISIRLVIVVGYFVSHLPLLHPLPLLTWVYCSIFALTLPFWNFSMCNFLFFCQLATFNCSEKYCQQKKYRTKEKNAKILSIVVVFYYVARGRGLLACLDCTLRVWRTLQQFAVFRKFCCHWSWVSKNFCSLI